MENKKRYTLGEEIFNAVTHGVGAALAVAGCIIVIVMSAVYGNAWNIVSSAVYGGTLIILYVMSTMYHSLTNKTAKKVFRIFDHCTIFLLIAGTYTPYTLVTIRGVWGWIVFSLVWGSATLGIVLNAVNMEKFKKFSMISYVASGWAIILAIKPLISSIAFGGLMLLLLGGIFYTVGIVFYAMKKLRYMHSIWHMFVLVGSVMHYFSILFYVAPIK